MCNDDGDPPSRMAPCAVRNSRVPPRRCDSRASRSRRTSVVLDLGAHDEQNPELEAVSWDIGTVHGMARRVANAVGVEQSHQRWLRRRQHRIRGDF